MKPQRITGEFKPYNTGGTYGEMGENVEISSDYTIVLDILVKRRIFKDDEVTGRAFLEDKEYIVSSDSTTETDDSYKLYLYTEGASVLDLDMRLDIELSKKFNMFDYWGPNFGARCKIEE